MLLIFGGIVIGLFIGVFGIIALVNAATKSVLRGR